MRRLALFCGGFAAGIFLAQYLLPGGWLLSGGLVCLALGFGALLLPECWRKRAILCLVGAALALGWNWLYVRQVSEPMEALADSQQALTMTLTEYPTETRFGAKVTVRAEGLPGKLTYYGDPPLLQLSPGQRLTDEVYLQSASRIRDDDVTVFNSKGVFLLAYSRGTAAFHAGTVDAPRWWPAGWAGPSRHPYGDFCPELTPGLCGRWGRAGGPFPRPPGGEAQGYRRRRGYTAVWPFCFFWEPCP